MKKLILALTLFSISSFADNYSALQYYYNKADGDNVLINTCGIRIFPLEEGSTKLGLSVTYNVPGSDGELATVVFKNASDARLTKTTLTQGDDNFSDYVYSSAITFSGMDDLEEKLGLTDEEFDELSLEAMNKYGFKVLQGGYVSVQELFTFFRNEAFEITGLQAQRSITINESSVWSETYDVNCEQYIPDEETEKQSSSANVGEGVRNGINYLGDLLGSIFASN